MIHSTETAQGRLPDTTKKPCNECPWRRNATPGYLGPETSEQWATWAHSGGPINCHKTVKIDDDWTQPGLRQCAGVATFRANAGKDPQPGVAIGPPDTERVFATSAEFLDHHDSSERLTDDGRLLARLLVDALFTVPGDPTAVSAELSRWTSDLGTVRMAQVAVAALTVTFGECMRHAPG